MLNQRTLIDVNLSATIALPAAGASVTTAAIDLVTTTPGRAPAFELRLSTSAALAALVDAKNMTFVLQDSADGVTWDNYSADLPAYVLTGANGAGAAALFAQFKAPINLQRYIRAQITADAAAGNSTAITATLSGVF